MRGRHWYPPSASAPSPWPVAACLANQFYLVVRRTMQAFDLRQIIPNQGLVRPWHRYTIGTAPAVCTRHQQSTHQNEPVAIPDGEAAHHQVTRPRGFANGTQSRSWPIHVRAVLKKALDQPSLEMSSFTDRLVSLNESHPVPMMV